MSAQLALINSMLRTFVKPVLHVTSFHPESLRKRRPLLCGIASLLPVPANIRITQIALGPIWAEWVDAVKNDAASLGRVVLYLHGGAYMVGSPITHRNITMRLARYANCRVLAINYRKAPHYPYPYPQEDALASYQWLLEQGYTPDKIMLAGDSAGGHLTLSTLLAIRDKGLPMPSGGVCLSPWTDLSGGGDSMHHNKGRDTMIPARRIAHAARHFANGMPLDDARISPLLAEFHGLPPLMIHVGDQEVLLHDSTRLAERATSHGVEVTLRVWRNAPHVFQLFAGIVPQSNWSLKEIALFMRKRMGVVEDNRSQADTLCLVPNHGA
ncbi:MAG TPA: alpha/beta hydrolase [Dongiaceae bacterium]|nr:alpha/beta hydrolase [Dongiaceae bacterium]